MSLTQSVPLEPLPMRDLCRFRGGSVLLQLVGQFGAGVNTLVGLQLSEQSLFRLNSSDLIRCGVPDTPLDVLAPRTPDTRAKLTGRICKF
jgi:hypothetical protein